MKTPRSWLTHYALSVAIVAVVIAIKSFVLRDGASRIRTSPSTRRSFSRDGMAASSGVLASLLAAVALAYLWLPPLYSLRIQDVQDASGLAVFVAIGLPSASSTSPPPRRSPRRGAEAETGAKQRQYHASARTCQPPYNPDRPRAWPRRNSKIADFAVWHPICDPRLPMHRLKLFVTGARRPGARRPPGRPSARRRARRPGTITHSGNAERAPAKVRDDVFSVPHRDRREVRHPRPHAAASP